MSTRTPYLATINVAFEFTADSEGDARARVAAIARLQVVGAGQSGRVAKHYLAPALAALGLAHVRWHDLRHAFAVMSLSAGEHYMAVSKMLGHTSFVTTLTVYAYITEGDGGKAAPPGGQHRRECGADAPTGLVVSSGLHGEFCISLHRQFGYRQRCFRSVQNVLCIAFNTRSTVSVFADFLFLCLGSLCTRL